MPHPNYARVVLHNLRRIIIFGVAVMAVVTGLSFIEPLKYSSSIRMLIIQPAALGYDPYTAIRAAERIGDNLAQVVYTTDFFNKAIAANAARFDIDASYFPDNDAKRRKLWGRMVSARVEPGTGLLNVTVYHPDKDQATQIAQAIAYVMTTEGANYIGGSALQIRLVDAPLVSRFPVKPNLLVNAFTGLVLGLLFGAVYAIVASSSRKYLVEHPPTFV
jgi:capsular polysaccharide biosynthesis protein